MLYCFGFGSALVMPTCSCSCSTVENLAAHPPKMKYHISASFSFPCILQLEQLSIYSFHKPRPIIKSHRIAQSEPWAASRIFLCISLLTYACPGRHVFVGPHLYSEQVLTVDSDRKCNSLRVSYCTPKPKTWLSIQAIIPP